jgi:hypothetical protein
MERSPVGFWSGVIVLGLVGLAGCNRPMTRPTRVHRSPGLTSRAVSRTGPQQLPDALASRKAPEDTPHGKSAEPPSPKVALGPTGGGEESAEEKPGAVKIKLGKGGEKKPDPDPAEAVIAATPPAETPKRPEAQKAEASFAHGEDYSWLRGEVEYSFLSKGWRLRYAPLDEEDKYGGSLTLVDGQQHHLRDGQLVQVNGFLVPGKDDRGHPRFRVLQMKPLDGPEEVGDAEGK